MKKPLPVVNGIDVAGKNVIVRADLEWPPFAEASEGGPSPREKATTEVVEWLKTHGAAKLKVIGHKGNWQREGIEIINDIRSDPREEMDDPGFAAELAEGFDVYVDEAFATAHRKHASFDALPRLMRSQGKPAVVGPRFAKEVEMLGQVLGRSGRKALVIGGAKASDKEKASEELAGKFDAVLKGGLLPGVKLRADGLDIADEAIEEYKRIIADAGTIVVAGPLGKYEDPGAEKGTREVFTAVANTQAYKVAGGGDTEAALVKFGLTQKFDWISVGGGAMLVYLSTGTLPGIEALIE